MTYIACTASVEYAYNTASMQRPCHPAAERYAAKLAGLYPEDPWLAALADQAYFQTDDAYMVRSSWCSRTCSLR